MKSINEHNELKDWFLEQKKLFEMGLLTDEQVCCLASLARKQNIKLNPPRNDFESMCKKFNIKR